ncbi:hypothetical protein AB0P15_16295 [Streptomyces sp. NPDC087917]|uniref:hypothetical protein n=1 Tax=unclassified Streptomyces TaxID=2593676 RepID=UPI003449B6D2
MRVARLPRAAIRLTARAAFAATAAVALALAAAGSASAVTSTRTITDGATYHLGLTAPGTTGASPWVDNTYGGTLPHTSAFGAGGTFGAGIHVKADLGGGQICGETVECAIVTRADHFNSANRTYDVHVPVTFN